MSISQRGNQSREREDRPAPTRRKGRADSDLVALRRHHAAGLSIPSHILGSIGKGGRTAESPTLGLHGPISDP